MAAYKVSPGGDGGEVGTIASPQRKFLGNNRRCIMGALDLVKVAQSLPQLFRLLADTYVSTHISECFDTT